MKALVLAALVGAAGAPAQLAPAGEALRWQQLAPIPDPEGFAASFAGVSQGALIVAGGANIAGEKWGETFTKRWHDSAFVLESPEGAWQSAGRLPRPLAYGVSITTESGLVCLGGSDSTKHYPDVFRLVWKDGALTATALPPLPRPCANACGALLGRTIYVAGGLENPAATSALRTFWSLDLDEPSPRWREQEPWPGPERMLAVAGVQDGSFFLFSGAKLMAGPDGKPVREYLRDAWRFTPGHGWKRLADLPRPAVAAPSPAIPLAFSHLLIPTGDDGSQVAFQPVKEHPGFPRDVLAYDVTHDAWHVAGLAPFSRATVPVIQWHDRFIIPNGEARPRVRTPEVWSLQLP